MLSNLEEIYSELTDSTLLIKADLSKYSTMKLKAMGNIVIIRSEKDLKVFLKQSFTHKVPYQLIGWGANTVLAQRVEPLLVKLELPWSKESLKPEADTFSLPASFPLNVLTSFAKKNNLKGWEVFTGIPASLGGAIFMNAGTRLGEIGDLVSEVILFTKSGEEKKISINKDSFSYRKNHFVEEGDVIVRATLKHQGLEEGIGDQIDQYLSKRNETQPLREKTCGCMFKNPENFLSAGHSLDLLGLKGLEIDSRLRVSALHGNFMENIGEASSEDVRELVLFVQQEMKTHFGVELQLEVKMS